MIPGNFTQEASLTRQRYGERTSRTAAAARAALAMARRDLYRCDPPQHKLGKPKVLQQIFAKNKGHPKGSHRSWPKEKAIYRRLPVNKTCMLLQKKLAQDILEPSYYCLFSVDIISVISASSFLCPRNVKHRLPDRPQL